ncbi:tRNA-uridine aminocarboxypropyltransferase [Thiomicrorhabdus lithotrophica]|uniref:tRNA-uridine aminocarboxypropyltransferase n=1 Tax=Thiomicrorhabdus lithotrophica TaxID=2949997 RepID=A0ABY8CBB9_9GAMM|nr:tRNA-uridine aminocarboxypropyltransferase [Thiomicrorhabdus lithotrophica]WEJ62107.1 DTW domain-containing protein [Thiomicrorhabdus lithotrophica]
MSRVICPNCSRPQKVCICNFIKSIDNRVEIAILQHPAEVKQIKGTAIIAQLALTHCKTWVGEQLSELPGLVTWLTENKNVFLLYPEIDNQVKECQVFDVGQIEHSHDFKVLILDGTWRKTFKMMQLNPELQALNRVSLTPTEQSKYRIRKQKDSQSLSTIEAIYELLSQLENSTEKFKPLLSAFEKVQNQQFIFREKE